MKVFGSNIFLEKRNKFIDRFLLSRIKLLDETLK